VNWSWIFFINIPVGVLGVVAARVFIDETKDTSKEQRLDVPGLITSAIGLFALTYGLIETNSHAWTSTRVLALFGIAVVALAAFVLLELRQRLPMLDLSLFRNPTFAGANAAMLLVGLAMFGIFFYNSLLLQRVLGYSAIETGATFLPLTLLIILVAPAAGRFSDRIGARWLMGAGMTLIAVSLLLFGTLDASSSFWNILPGLLVGGVGMATTMAPTTAAAMGSVPVAKAGVGSAVINSMRQVGGSLGIAIMGALVATRVSVPPTDPLWRGEFVGGYHRAVHLGAALVLVGAIISVTTVRRLPRHEGAAEPAAAAGTVEPATVEGELRLPQVKVVDRVAAAETAAPIEEAKVIVAGGRGVGGPDGFRVVEELAEALGGAVGATRAAVDAGWIPYAQQIGQTGKIVKPALYLALGISGAIQHKVGMQTAGTIVAVNRDPDAPIAEFADVVVIGDLFEVVPAILAALRARAG